MSRLSIYLTDAEVNRDLKQITPFRIEVKHFEITGPLCFMIFRAMGTGAEYMVEIEAV